MRRFNLLLLGTPVLLIGTLKGAAPPGVAGRWQSDAVSLPLLLEQSLPSTLRLKPSDSIDVQLTLSNISRYPVGIKHGRPLPKLEAQAIAPLKRDDSAGRRQISFQRANEWGAVRYFESPSPYAVYTSELYQRTLEVGESASFSWRASPLPIGEYMLRACIELLEAPRAPEGGWQHVRWCAARETHLMVAP